jgi:hypothetical protein
VAQILSGGVAGTADRDGRGLRRGGDGRVYPGCNDMAGTSHLPYRN